MPKELKEMHGSQKLGRDGTIGAYFYWWSCLKTM
jgi:hypothetical protein